MASLAFAQEDPDCYILVDGCPDGGALPDTDVDDDESVRPKPPSSPGGVQVAGQAPVVLAQTTPLAQTGLPAATLLAVVGLTLASGVVLLLMTRRRAS